MSSPNPVSAQLFQIDALLGAARQAAGAPDGYRDDEFIEPLEHILSDLRADTAQLSDVGAQGLHAQLVGGLVTRILVRTTIAAHPEILK